MRLALPAVFPLLALANLAAAEETAPVDFGREVRPILAKSCFACHGPDDAHRKAGLRLDRRDAAISPRKRGGAAIVPGKPDASELIRRITSTDESEVMPPKKSGGLPFSQAQVSVLKRWIAQGATYPEHWAYVKPQRPPLPAVKDTSWPRVGLDHFILARLEKEGLRPAEPADRFVLLRRVSLDLRGLPPTPAEVEAFARDQSPDAYEKAVDRMFADPAYGERWARVWLDLARYADSAGYGSDPLRTIWRYRDWVIDAFNRDLPYDRFTIEQIAGDLVPNPTPEQRMATAFHRNTMTNTEGGTDREEYRVAAVKDRVDTTFQVWMGVTMGCAKCHNHKYEPISQLEYYRFYAFFNQSADADRPDEAPVIDAPTPEEREKAKAVDARLAALRKKLAEPKRVAVRAVRFTPIPVESLDVLWEIGVVAKTRPIIPTLPVMEELASQKQRATYLMVKGNFLSPGDKVESAVPAAFPPLPKGAPVNRLGVAQWLVSPDNPLTARVAVNRLWSQLFGTGIVETEEDFGTQGELPSHPELLDWLATEYVRLNWSTKALLREIVTSATYRQSSRVTPELLAKDPKNRLLSRGPRFRLEAEELRDQALALSGLLSRKIHGPSVFPPQPPGLWQAAFNGQRTWATSTGEDRYRRGLYTFWRRTIPYPSMATFDAPSREICTVRRIRTNTPLQAFVTLNDPVYVEAARALAHRIIKEGGATPEARADYALRLCLCRPALPEQVSRIVELFKTEHEHYGKDSAAALALATETPAALPKGMDAAELAAWTVVANVLLNMDAVLTKG
jgi:mono/diheme cytochrome c family protein